MPHLHCLLQGRHLQARSATSQHRKHLVCSRGLQLRLRASSWLARFLMPHLLPDRTHAEDRAIGVGPCGENAVVVRVQDGGQRPPQQRSLLRAGQVPQHQPLAQEPAGAQERSAQGAVPVHSTRKSAQLVHSVSAQQPALRLSTLHAYPATAASTRAPTHAKHARNTGRTVPETAIAAAYACLSLVSTDSGRSDPARPLPQSQPTAFKTAHCKQCQLHSSVSLRPDQRCPLPD